MEDKKVVDQTTPENGEASTPKTYTQEEVEKLIQSESDRKVSLALQRKEKELKNKMTEAERLAKMSEEDQLRYKLEQKDKELAIKEAEFAQKENKITAMKVLSEKGLETSLVDYVVDADADIMFERINTLEKAIKRMVDAQVKQRLGGSVPPKAGSVVNTQMTKAEFEKLGYKERMELYTTDRELYNKLSKK